jgi:hypothetical protein
LPNCRRHGRDRFFVWSFFFCPSAYLPTLALSDLGACLGGFAPRVAVLSPPLPTPASRHHHHHHFFCVYDFELHDQIADSFQRKQSHSHCFSILILFLAVSFFLS